MALPRNLPASLPFFLGAGVQPDPETITVRAYGPGGGGVVDPALSAGRITNVDSDGGYQYTAIEGELAYPGLYLYTFAGGGGFDSVRFEAV